MTKPPNQPPGLWVPPDPSHFAPPAYTPPLPESDLSGRRPGPDESGLIIGVVIGGVCLVAIIGVVVFLVARPDDGSAATEAEPGATSATDHQPGSEHTGPGPSVDPNADIQGDGTYLVGSELKAGEYSTTVPESASLCYWERLSGTSGEFDDIIANGVADPGEKVTVTVEAKDKAFKTQGCGTWARA